WRRGLQLRERDAPLEHLRFPPLLTALALVELRHDLAREQLEASADVLVRRPSRLIEQDDLVDAGGLKLPQPPPDGLGRADQTRPQRLLRLRCLPPVLVEPPHVAPARLGTAVEADT